MLERKVRISEWATSSGKPQSRCVQTDGHLGSCCLRTSLKLQNHLSLLVWVSELCCLGRVREAEWGSHPRCSLRPLEEQVTYF